MIGIDRDGLVRHVRDHELRYLAVGAAALQGHSGLRVQVVRQHAALDLLDQLLVARAVSLVGFDADALAVANSHAFDGFIEAGDDLAAAHLEFQRVPALRRVELGAVVEGAGIVNFYGVSGFCLAHESRSECG